MNNLKNILLVNACFSALSGVVMLSFPASLNQFFNLTNPIVFPIIGANLLVFALFVGFVAFKKLGNSVLVRVITVADWLWVLGSFAIVAFQLFGISKNGYVLTSAVAVWIAFLAFQQFRFTPK